LLRCKIVVAKNVGDFEVGVSGAGVDNGENWVDGDCGILLIDNGKGSNWSSDIRVVENVQVLILRWYWLVP
jgi:hypothetical protein